MKLIWVRQADSGEVRYREASSSLIDGYIQHVQQAYDQNHYSVPCWKDTYWLVHEERMKLAFYLAEDAKAVGLAERGHGRGEEGQGALGNEHGQDLVGL